MRGFLLLLGFSSDGLRVGSVSMLGVVIAYPSSSLRRVCICSAAFLDLTAYGPRSGTSRSTSKPTGCLFAQHSRPEPPNRLHCLFPRLPCHTLECSFKKSLVARCQSSHPSFDVWIPLNTRCSVPRRSLQLRVGRVFSQSRIAYVSAFKVCCDYRIWVEVAEARARADHYQRPRQRRPTSGRRKRQT
ncbi:uncharacterized protein IWZ02DRAFT_156445 [Phyllosticta citriasiana]|uniref:uncharacterized protein n=1 Tax=Phyllosticta citriasiana TaxID=595635 RepID=UPI0030FDAEA2